MHADFRVSFTDDKRRLKMLLLLEEISFLKYKVE